MTAAAGGAGVRERPIIFTGSNVLSILAGRKTQTRRVLKLPTKGIYEHPKMGGWAPTTTGGAGVFTLAKDGTQVPCSERVAIWHRTTGDCLDAPWQRGDGLWVRETWQLHSRATDLCTIVYRASVNGAWSDAHEQFPDNLAAGMQPRPFQSGWRSPIHMPRWASRLTLVVTDVRVERLQDISEADAVAEGVHRLAHSDGPNLYTVEVDHGSFSAPTASEVYAMLWNAIHGPGAWDLNPWIAAVTFEPDLGRRALASRATGDWR